MNRAASSSRTPGILAAPACSSSSVSRRSRPPARAWRGRWADRDNALSLGDVLAHIGSIAHGVDVPVNADFEGGFAIDPAAVAVNVSAATATGVAGLSIEDSTGDPLSPLFEFSLAVERIRAARRAIDGTGSGVFLTARSEGFIVGRPDLVETIRRLYGLRGGGRGLPVCPRNSIGERHRRGRRRRRTQAGERAGWR